MAIENIGHFQKQLPGHKKLDRKLSHCEVLAKKTFKNVLTLTNN